MQILREITSDWKLDFVPNHTYHLNDEGRLVAYQHLSKGPIITFSKSMPFNKARRKFVKL